MTSARPRIIQSTNLTRAWSRAFLRAMGAPGGICGPTLVSIRLRGEEPAEDGDVRTALDAALQQSGKVTTQDNAFMIFPFAVWSRHRDDPEWLYARYRRMAPRLRARCRLNQYGTYFGRMIDFTGTRNGETRAINQIEHVLKIWDRAKAQGRRPRASALQIACFDPVKDHTGQALRGFPCLQQVSLACDGRGGLALHAYYPTQYLFDRAYGNYLGLCHLGLFLANAMGLRLRRVTCYVAQPELGDATKSSLRELAAVVRRIVA